MKKPALIASLSLFVLPFLFFGLTVFVVLSSSFYLLSNPQITQNVKERIKEPVYTIFNSQPPVLGVSDAQISGVDGRAAVLTQYFAQHKAPLAAYGQKLVEEADKHNLDWKLLPSIAMQESNGGKKIPENSHNAWGWAIHSAYTKKFETWEGAIETVAQGLKTDYIDRGLITPYQIMTRYTPLSLTKGGSWAKGVEYFIRELENF